jgi:hypothetical protein
MYQALTVSDFRSVPRILFRVGSDETSLLPCNASLIFTYRARHILVLDVEEYVCRH